MCVCERERGGERERERDITGRVEKGRGEREIYITGRVEKGRGERDDRVMREREGDERAGCKEGWEIVGEESQERLMFPCAIVSLDLTNF